MPTASLTHILQDCGAASSPEDARRLVRSRRVYLDGERIEHAVLPVEVEAGSVLQVGDEVYRFRGEPTPGRVK